jgi:hypothetical protein
MCLSECILDVAACATLVHVCAQLHARVGTGLVHIHMCVNRYLPAECTGK